MAVESLTTIEHYRPGTTGGAAGGFGLKSGT
jgi:hypothetical protein